MVLVSFLSRPISIRLMPFEKMKVYRISVILEGSSGITGHVAPPCRADRLTPALQQRKSITTPTTRRWLGTRLCGDTSCSG